MTTRIAIVGAGKGYKDAPYDEDGVLVWGIARHWKKLDRFDALFEMHHPTIWADYLGVNPITYANELNALGCPVVTHGPVKRLKRSIAFPFKKCVDRYGEAFVGSVSYMLAFAIMQGPDTISLHGVNCLGHEEYVYQRPNMEWWRGVAHGEGINIEIDKHSALGRFGPPYGSKAWYMAGGDKSDKAALKRLATGVA